MPRASAETGPGGLLDGVRIVECSLLEPAAVGMVLAELGAEVVKVEPPGGDYVRQMTWPVVRGVSLMHLRVNRGKRSIVLDLRNPQGVEVFLDLVRTADAVVDTMRPGALDRRGLGFERLREVKPDIVVCSLTGWGRTGPYRDMPSHGIAFDCWAGLVEPEDDGEGFAALPRHASVGIRFGPVWAAYAICAALLRARVTGRPAYIDIAQADTAAIANWLEIEGWRAYERPEDEVTGNAADGGERRPPGTAGMLGAVRYQAYRTTDGHVLLMASEREFWRNFCVGVGRPDLFESRPGSRYADHARGDRELQRELRDIFAGRSTQEWVRFGVEANCPITPINTSASVAADPQFRQRLPWLSMEEYGADLMPTPVRVDGEAPVRPSPAPAPGESTHDVLAGLLGYDEARIGELERVGALGGGSRRY